jgi:glyoxylase-like metal-dependent hydrolase (beta-lactamase superfamily II)
VLDTAGHTPAHISLELEGKDELVITGDVAVNQVASFRYPKERFAFDTDSDLAIRNRLKLLDRAAADHTKLLGYHWAYPGIGFAERRGDAFHYVATA